MGQTAEGKEGGANTEDSSTETRREGKEGDSREGEPKENGKRVKREKGAS